MGELDRKRHQLGGVAARIAEHQALVAGALGLLGATIDALRDLGRLPADREQDGDVLGRIPARRIAITDLTDDATRDGLKGMDGKLVSEKDLEFGTAKLPGREVVVDRGKYQIRCRFLIRESRLYQLAVLGSGEFVTGKDATAFLDSFEIK